MLEPSRASKHYSGPKLSPFTQQRMKTWHPVPTVKIALIILVSIALIFYAFGITILLISEEIIEIAERYDDVGACDDTDWDNPTLCSLTIDVEEDMKSPIYVYYELHNFF
jgi:hypothetical protein